MSVPLRPDDPAHWMLEQGRKDPSKRSVQTGPKRDDCYICTDPEFALMGLPLCTACEKCGGHVPADGSVCSDCGHDEFTGADESEQGSRASHQVARRSHYKTSARRVKG